MGIVEQLSAYRHLITLEDGLRVCLRPLTSSDRDAIVELFTSLPAEELQYFRGNIADPELVASWAESRDYGRVFPLVAVVNDRIVGSSTLYMGSLHCKHIAEIRTFLARDYRRRGIGSAMLKVQVEIARKFGLRQLVAEIVESQPQVLHAFERFGFERQCVLKEQFVTPDGDCLDMFVLVKYLKRPAEDF